MEIQTGANNNVNSYGKEFSSTPKQMEHQKAMTQENHDYQLKMQKAQHDHEISMRNMDLGKVGWLFGSSMPTTLYLYAQSLFLLSCKFSI